MQLRTRCDVILFVSSSGHCTLLVSLAFSSLSISLEAFDSLSSILSLINIRLAYLMTKGELWRVNIPNILVVLKNN